MFPNFSDSNDKNPPPTALLCVYYYFLGFFYNHDGEAADGELPAGHSTRSIRQVGTQRVQGSSEVFVPTKVKFTAIVY